MSEKILTKEYIEELGYDVEELDYRIFLVKNFIKENESEELVKFAKSATDEEWSYEYINGAKKLAKLKFGREDLDNLVSEGLYELTDNWIDKNLNINEHEIAITLNDRCKELFKFRDDIQFNGCSTIQRQYEGVLLKDHVDNHTDPSLEYAVIFYLNDEYSNGEVYFVNQKIELRPPKNSILIFPTTENWRHGVNSPGPGPHRYVIPGFVARRNFWKSEHNYRYNISEHIRILKNRSKQCLKMLLIIIKNGKLIK